MSYTRYGQGGAWAQHSQHNGSAGPDSHDSLPRMREALAPEYAELAPEELESLIADTFGEAISAAEMEEIFGAIADFGKKAARAVASVGKDVGRTVAREAPKIAREVGPIGAGMAQGAMAGSALGPWGMLGGAVVGGTGTALQRYGKGDVKAAGNFINTGVGIAGTFGGGGLGALGRSGIGAVAQGGLQGLAQGGLGGLARGALGGITQGTLGGGTIGRIAQGAIGGLTQGGLGGLARGAVQGALGGGANGAVGQGVVGSGALGPFAQTGGIAQGNPAAGQLLNVLTNPQTLQALQAMVLTPIGRQEIPVGDAQVPVAAFTTLISQLAGLAQAGHHAAIGAEPQVVPEYLIESTGEYRCDPADPAQRAELLWELLQSAESEFEEMDELPEEDEAAEDYFDELHDAAELAEIAEFYAEFDEEI